MRNTLTAGGLFLLTLFLSPWASGKDQCIACHQEEQGFSPFHDPQAIGCVSCHGGNGQSNIEEIAHQQMEHYPGRMATAASSCGQSDCHQALIPLVENSIMNTLDGMISLTRQLFGEDDQARNNMPMNHRLAEKGADSYLRKLCVSCHLGTERQHHQQTLRDRGGGCAACHLQTFKEGSSTHPRLTVRIHNDRCFGCHSRSGRISLNYVGLAEVEQVDWSRKGDFGYLPDRRLVEKLKPDLHNQAGIACIDCHTVNGLMGTGVRVPQQRKQLDIQCMDCHQSSLNKKPATSLTQREAIYPALYPGQYHVSDQGEVVVTEKQGTPLFHIQEHSSQRFLHKKLTKQKIRIPISRNGLHHALKGHERLTCQSCHSAWAPQCYGCHISYDETQNQWDHLLRKKTKGKWIENRWHLKNTLPALGITADNRITPFIPGMNFTLEKGLGEPPIIQIRYSQISPHTTQKTGRSCESCHQSEAALGMIQEWAVSPQNSEWKTPVGWIEKDALHPGQALQKGARSFNRQEIKRIQKVGDCLKCHSPENSFYQDFQKKLNYTHVNH